MAQQSNIVRNSQERLCVTPDFKNIVGCIEITSGYHWLGKERDCGLTGHVILEIYRLITYIHAVTTNKKDSEFERG